MENKTVKLSQILEVWESFSGWYWFVTEYHDDHLAFGLVRGFEIEWGYFDLDELKGLVESHKVWKVPKKNWAFCPCVEDDAASNSHLTHPSGLRQAGSKAETRDEKTMPVSCANIEGGRFVSRRVKAQYVGRPASDNYLVATGRSKRQQAPSCHRLQKEVNS